MTRTIDTSARDRVPSYLTGRISRRSALARLGQAAVAVSLPAVSSATGTVRAAEASVAQRRLLAQEIEHVLWEKIVPAWFPRCVDEEHGGFYEHFAQDWTRGPVESKFLVYQARMTWTPAAVALQYARDRERLVQYARHGMRFLGEKFWDAKHGGFFDRTDAAGNPDLKAMPWKQLYSYAFGIFASATAHQATGDPQALELAQAAFAWLDQHAHDAEKGGYFEHLTAEGRPVAKDVPHEQLGQGLPVIGQVGYKSMNAHIHILEALIALRRVWEDAGLTARLNEVFEIVRDKIVLPGGHLNMFATRDFKPRDERSSFGHELEMAYLLMEAAERLPRDDRQATRRIARQLVDHALQWGWDAEHGGFFDEGPPTGPATRRNKVWWVQPEGMNGLLTLSRLEPREPIYFQRFVDTWSFFRDRMLDPRHGDCYDTVDPAGKPLKTNKASPWKAAYHVTRGLLFAVDQLRG